ncbi:MAG: ATP-binding protein [Kiritimatiellae bacterium]|nr:ATP-binding protein [Kiritimatiellia bacterium]
MQAMHFESSRPVDGVLFVDREQELARLDMVLEKLLAERSSFIALLGLRKVGKTSLVQEWMRRSRAQGKQVAFVNVPCWAWSDPHDFFVEYLRLTLNAAFSVTGLRQEAGILPFSSRPSQELAFSKTAARRGMNGIDTALSLYMDRAKIEPDAFMREAVRMAGTIARQDGVRFQYVLDEFQTLRTYDQFSDVKNHFGSVYALFREEWQKQKGCNYLVSGSAITLMKQILDEPSAPFFQHFTQWTLGALPREDAARMLADFSERSGHPLAPDTITAVVDTLGTNPYYLQTVGEEIVTEMRLEPGDPNGWKRAVQKVLFDASGRLYQYFEKLHVSITAESSILEKIVFALADGPKIGADIARTAGMPQNRISPKLPLLQKQDVILKQDGVYALADRCYAVWLRVARDPKSTAAAPGLIGDESEKRVAASMAAQGLHLVYQSRASRGAFDLLAIYQHFEIGVQVKKKAGYPVYISDRELGRMRKDAETLGWLALVAFDIKGEIHYHSLNSGAKTRRGRRFDEASCLAHVLDVLDEE